jgi:2-haloacid dehalogenase
VASTRYLAGYHPDLTRLESRYIIAPNLNGQIALLLSMAKRARIPWDAILGAEVAKVYKPKPEECLRNVATPDL